MLFEVTKMLQSKFEIYHSTIQVEPNPKKTEPQGQGNTKLTNCINEYNFAVGNVFDH